MRKSSTSRPKESSLGSGSAHSTLMAASRSQAPPACSHSRLKGFWQGLKVFELEDIDPKKWAVTKMSGIKRSGKSRGAVRGHRFGIGSDVLLGYQDARMQIYLPAQVGLGESSFGTSCTIAVDCVPEYLSFARLRDERRRQRPIKPLSHAALVKCYLVEAWPV